MKYLALLTNSVFALDSWSGGPSWAINYDSGSSSLRFTADVPKDQWFGISYQQGMINVDMVVFAAEGDAGSVTDLWSVSYGTPGADGQ